MKFKLTDILGCEGYMRVSYDWIIECGNDYDRSFGYIILIFDELYVYMFIYSFSLSYNVHYDLFNYIFNYIYTVDT